MPQAFAFLLIIDCRKYRPLSNELCQCLLVDRAVPSAFFALHTPTRDNCSFQRKPVPMFVQALDASVLGGLAGFDEPQLGVVLVRPWNKYLAVSLRTLVGSNCLWQRPDAGRHSQGARHVGPRMP